MNLTHIECRFLERRRMRAARAWRCFLELPDNPMLAVGLTALIERQMAVRIAGCPQAAGEVEVEIDPAYIVDVPSKGKRFQIVIETVHELQSNIGPTLTALTGCPVTLSISQAGTTPDEPVSQRGTISDRTLQGLHIAFFKNDRFADFLRFKTGRVFSNGGPNGWRMVKIVFKEHMGVESCRGLNQEDFDALLQEFNDWLNSGGARG